MATKAEIDARLTAHFGSAAAWAVSAEPVTKRGIIPEMSAKLESYDGQGFVVDGPNDQISQPKKFVVVRHVPSDGWYLVAGWDD